MAEKIEIWIEGHDGLSRVAQGASKQLGVLEGHSRKSAAGMNLMAEHMDHAQHSMAGMNLMMKGMSMTMLSLPFLAVAGGSLKSAAAFEQTANVTQQVTHATDAQRIALEKLGLQLGKDTVFSAGEAMQGELALAKAGLDVNEVMAAMPGVMDLAAAGELSIAAAAETAATAVNAFGLDASKTMDVANMLAAAANASSVEVKDLRDSFQMASAVASKAGIPVDALTTSLALLGNAGIKGSDAGTSFKQMLLALQAPSKQAKGILKELGISIYDTSGRMRDQRDIIDQFTKATGKLTQKSRDEALAIIFGSDAVRAANILLTEGVEKYDAMSKAVGKAGAAQEVANARMKGLAGAVEYLKGSVDSFLIGQGLPFTQTIGDWARGLADLINAFDKIPPSVQQGLAVIVGLTGALLATGGVIAGMIASITMIGAPILMVSAAIVGLATAWATNWNGMRDRTIEAVNGIRPYLQTLTEWLDRNLGTVLQVSSVAVGAWAAFTVGRFAWTAAQATIHAATVAQAFTVTMVGSIASAIPAIIAILAPLLPALILVGAWVYTLKTAWDKNFLDIQGITQRFVSTIKYHWQELMADAISITPMVKIISVAWNSDMQNLMTTVQTFAKYVGDTLGKMHDDAVEAQTGIAGSRESVLGGKYRGTDLTKLSPSHGIVAPPPNLSASHKSGRDTAKSFWDGWLDEWKQGLPDLQKLLRGMTGDISASLSQKGVFLTQEDMDRIEQARKWAEEYKEFYHGTTGDISLPKPPGLDIDWDDLLKKAKKTAKEAGLSMQDFTRALIATHPATLAAAAAVDTLKRRIGDMGLAIIANKDQLKAAQDEFGRMGDKLTRLNDKLSVAKQRLSDLATPRLTGQGAMDKQIAQLEGYLKRVELAKLTGKPIGDILKQFPSALPPGFEWIFNLPTEQIEDAVRNLLQQMQLTRDIDFGEQLAKIREAAEGIEDEMSFDDALRSITNTKGEIADLTTAVGIQEIAMQAQKEVMQGLTDEGERLNAALATMQEQLKGVEADQTAVNAALEDAYQWLLDDRQKMIEMGGEAATQAGIISDKTQGLLAAMDTYASDISSSVGGALGGVVSEYRTAVDNILAELSRVPGMSPLAPAALPVTKPYIPQAQGGSGVVTKPTLFLAGEAGPESYWFGGANGRGAGPGMVWTGDVIVHGTVVTERQLVEAVRQGLIRTDRRNVTSGV